MIHHLISNFKLTQFGKFLVNKINKIIINLLYIGCDLDGSESITNIIYLNSPFTFLLTIL